MSISKQPMMKFCESKLPTGYLPHVRSHPGIQRSIEEGLKELIHKYIKHIFYEIMVHDVVF